MSASLVQPRQAQAFLQWRGMYAVIPQCTDQHQWHDDHLDVECCSEAPAPFYQAQAVPWHPSHADLAAYWHPASVTDALIWHPCYATHAATWH
eukprot:5044547-Amphidinium_carterae.1